MPRKFEVTPVTRALIKPRPRCGPWRSSPLQTGEPPGSGLEGPSGTNQQFGRAVLVLRCAAAVQRHFLSGLREKLADSDPQSDLGASPAGLRKFDAAAQPDSQQKRLLLARCNIPAWAGPHLVKLHEQLIDYEAPNIQKMHMCAGARATR